MKCIKCGNEIPDGSRFCSFCGAEQKADAGNSMNSESGSPADSDGSGNSSNSTGSGNSVNSGSPADFNSSANTGSSASVSAAPKKKKGSCLVTGFCWIVAVDLFIGALAFLLGGKIISALLMAASAYILSPLYAKNKQIVPKPLAKILAIIFFILSFVLGGDILGEMYSSDTSTEADQPATEDTAEDTVTKLQEITELTQCNKAAGGAVYTFTHAPSDDGNPGWAILCTESGNRLKVYSSDMSDMVNGCFGTEIFEENQHYYVYDFSEERVSYYPGEGNIMDIDIISYYYPDDKYVLRMDSTDYDGRDNMLYFTENGAPDVIKEEIAVIEQTWEALGISEEDVRNISYSQLGEMDIPEQDTFPDYYNGDYYDNGADADTAKTDDGSADAQDQLAEADADTVEDTDYDDGSYDEDTDYYDGPYDEDTDYDDGSYDEDDYAYDPDDPDAYAAAMDGIYEAREQLANEYYASLYQGDIIEICLTNGAILDFAITEWGTYHNYNQDYLYITVQIENVGSSDAFISTYDFSAYFNNTYIGWATCLDDRELSGGSLSPGRSTSGMVIFDGDPATAGTIEIEYQDQVFQLQ